MNDKPMESRAAELENLLASDKALAVAPVEVPAKKRRLSIGATKYFRRDKKRFTFVWHLEKRNLED